MAPAEAEPETKAEADQYHDGGGDEARPPPPWAPVVVTVFLIVVVVSTGSGKFVADFRLGHRITLCEADALEESRRQKRILSTSRSPWSDAARLSLRASRPSTGPTLGGTAPSARLALVRRPYLGRPDARDGTSLSY